MTRTFYDAIDPSQLPKDGDGYLGYDDGNWPDADAIAAMFPGKLVMQITTNPAHNKGIIGDGPPDNGRWPDWVAWVKMRRAAGEDPWLNTDESLWQAGKDAFKAANEPEPNWWIALYDNDPTIMPGALMKQYASNNGYDTSSAADYLPGIDPAPTPPAKQENETMHQQLVYDEVNHQQHFIYFVGGAVLHRVYDETTKRISDAVALPGALNRDAGIDAKIMMHGSQLHVFGTFSDTSKGTGAHYWLHLPCDVGVAESWGTGVI